MSQNRTRVQSRTRPTSRVLPADGAAAASSNAARPATRATARTVSLPIDVHRVIAAVALVLLAALALLTPVAPAAPDVTAMTSPSIDGSGSASVALNNSAADQAFFRYLSVVERSSNSSTSIPDQVADILRYEPDSLRARKALVGQIIASSSGNLDQTLVDTGFFANLTPDKQDAIESAYQTMADAGSSDKQSMRGINGLGAMALVHSLSLTGAERAQFEALALKYFQTAVNAEPSTWQFTYNWALANMLMGNYAAAYESMRGIGALADKDNNKLTPFWLGLAALRVGDPGEAKIQFQQALDAKIPAGGNGAFEDLYKKAASLSREGLADSLWANREPAAAYDKYYEFLSLGDTGDTGLYSKWLSLGLQQRAYERLVRDMASLEATEFGKEPRIHHDRARLLSFLGRTSEAEGEYREALRLGQDDPALHVSYGMALESKGDHTGALTEAEAAIRGLGSDPGSSDLSSVASAAVTNTTSLVAQFDAQQLLDANLLRARAWGAQGKSDLVNTLVTGITQKAGSTSAAEAGLLNLYAGFAAEAGGLKDRAVASYNAAWDDLKAMHAGTPGRAAALAGLARATAAAGGNGVDILKNNGYSLQTKPETLLADKDAPTLLMQAAMLTTDPIQKADLLRVAAHLGNVQDAQSLTGSGRPLWYPNGTSVPSEAALLAADAARDAGNLSVGEVAMRYREAFSLDPALAPAWNNLGVFYSQHGNPDLASFYLKSAGQVSPGYALGGQNLASQEYERGLGNFFSAETAQGDAIKAAGPQSLQWGSSLQADNRGPFPAPSAPASNFMSRLPALIILLLLLLHTLVGNDKVAARTKTLLPTKGVLGTLGTSLESAARKVFPGLVQGGSSAGALLLAIAIPSVLGMLALAWIGGRGSLSVALVYLPAALLIALLAFGANEVGQYLEARRNGAVTVHHVWPLGLLLGIVSIPLGFLYGWQTVTRVQPAPGSGLGEGEAPGRGRTLRTEDDLDLAYEARVEAAAENEPVVVTAGGGRYLTQAHGARQLFGLSPAARILVAGFVANLLVGIIFAVGYWLTGWPSLRLGIFASMLVLAFTAVSEPPADGWTLYRRNAPLWLAIFVIAATVVTLLATGLI